MDWDFAIKRKRTELGAIIATLLAMVAACASREARAAISRILRPAESALRRLIVIYANRKPKPQTDAQCQKALPDFAAFRPSWKDRVPAFRLIDPRKRFAQQDDKIDQAEPRIWAIGMAQPTAASMKQREPDAVPNVASLKRRIAALDHALKTLPAQARRLARQMAKRRHALPGPRRVGPIRPGWPPGYRLRHRHGVDDILLDCHRLALDALGPPGNAGTR